MRNRPTRPLPPKPQASSYQVRAAAKPEYPWQKTGAPGRSEPRSSDRIARSKRPEAQSFAQSNDAAAGRDGRPFLQGIQAGSKSAPTRNLVSALPLGCFAGHGGRRSVGYPEVCIRRPAPPLPALRGDQVIQPDAHRPARWQGSYSPPSHPERPLAPLLSGRHNWHR